MTRPTKGREATQFKAISLAEAQRKIEDIVDRSKRNQHSADTLKHLTVQKFYSQDMRVQEVL